MTAAWLEIFIIVFIVGGFALILWKGGAANPVGTGTLQTRVASIDALVKGLSADIGRHSERMKALETSCASSAEIEALKEAMQGDRRRTEQVYEKIESIEAELAEMQTQQGRRDAVIEALSKSVRSLATDLRKHQTDIADKLGHIDAMSERVDASTRAIDAILQQLPELREKQAGIAARQAETATDVKHVMRAVDRLYDVLVPKGME